MHIFDKIYKGFGRQWTCYIQCPTVWLKCLFPSRYNIDSVRQHKKTANLSHTHRCLRETKNHPSHSLKFILIVFAFTSVSLWDDVGDITVRHKGKMEDVGGLVLACQRVKNLTVNSDLDVHPLGVTHLKQRRARTHTQKPFWENHTWTFKSFKSHLFSGFWKLFFKF